MKDRKYKIAIVIPKFGLVGGAEQFAARLTGEMVKQGYDFHVFTRSWETSSYPVTFHPTRIITFPRFLITPSFAWFAGYHTKRENCDLIHSHDRIFHAQIFTLHGVPHRYWAKEVRGKKYLSLFDRATVWVERQMVRRNTRSLFVAVSKLAKDVFLREYQLDPERIIVIHPGVGMEVNPREFKTSARQYLNYKYGLGKNERIIFFASMNFEIKGLPEIISALAQVAKKERAFRLIVAGKGNWKRYEIMTGQAGIGNHIIFAGVLNKEELNRHYLGSDFYIMLSRFDTFGLVVLEAMACGLPVIVSSSVGAQDLIVEGKNGFIIGDITDYETIADKILFLFQDHNLRSMSEAAYETARNCTWQESAQKYHLLYQQFLTSPR